MAIGWIRRERIPDRGAMLAGGMGLQAILAAGGAAVAGDKAAASQPSTAPANGEKRAEVVFSGGYETYGPDGGRPVVLIAARLGRAGGCLSGDV